jgi:hypothetical protein
MSQSSIIFPVYMPVSIDSFIEMMNKDEHNVEQKNTLVAIKQFISDDHDKFIQLMRLESKPEKNTLIQVVAQNGRHDIVEFLIDQAMKSELGKKILRDLLTRVDAFDRSIIHWIAQINKDDVAQCLTAILDASNQLDITHYVNLKENALGATPLMMAVRQGAISNIRVLVEHGADIYAKSKDNETVLDLIKYVNPKMSIPAMKYFIKNTALGYSTFINIHGEDFKKIYDAKKDEEDKNLDSMLSTLIEIDIDASIPHELAQLSALKSLITSTLKANTPEEANIMLATHSQIDFAKALQGYKAHVKDDKHTLLNEVFDKTLKNNAEFNLSENNTALLAKATLLLSFHLPKAHQSALSLLMLLMIGAPKLALEGFKKINPAYLDADNQFLLTRYTLFSMANMKLKELAPIEHDNILLRYLFDKNTLFSNRQEKMDACKKLQILLDAINKAKDILDLQTSIQKISEDIIKLKIVDDIFWSEMLEILSEPKRSLPSINI